MVAAADDAGVTMVTGRPSPQAGATTGTLPTEIDRLQHAVGEGPGLDAAREHRTYLVRDTSADDRWSVFAPAAAQVGLRSMVCFPLPADTGDLGTLTLLSRRVVAFGGADIAAGELISTHAAIALLAARTEDQLQSALASRDTIGQAKGIIMERYDLDAVAAFDLLRTLSQQLNIPVATLSARMVERPE